MGYRLLHLNFVTGILPKWHKSVDVAVTALWRGTLQLRRGTIKQPTRTKCSADFHLKSSLIFFILLDYATTSIFL